MKKLPIGIQTFSKVVGEGYLYVDKTREIYNLVANGGHYYFLSRPRRFGKSLLLSTLKELFSGNRELFKDLWIYDRLDWQRFNYPIITIDFSKISYKSPEILEKEINIRIEEIAAENNITLIKERNYDSKFGELLKKLSGARGQVALLIDEYDKPIIDYIDNPGIALANRDVLRTFYSAIKGSDEYLKFVFLTGVSKFSRVSLFSGLNNLRDITMSREYSTMLGYTQEEIESYFSGWFEELTKKFSLSRTELLGNIKDWYNGYSWDGENFLYNPFSILNFFQEGEFGNYWFSTGTPGFMFDALSSHKVDIESLERYRAGDSLFESFEIDNLNVPSLLFQTGYLTIKEVERVDVVQRLFTLTYPNKEVKKSFLEHLLGFLSEKYTDEIGVISYELKRSLSLGDLDSFFDKIKSVFASIPYNIIAHGSESYFHSIFYVILTLLGVNIRCEIQTNKGRIDAELEVADNIYIMEFKMGGASEALDQIIRKKYYEKHLGTKKALFLVGVGFDEKDRNISGFLAEMR